MNRIFNWYNRLGLATKHFLFLLILTFSLFSVLAWTNLRDAQALFREQVIRDAELLVGRTDQLLDAYLDNVQNMLLLLSSRADLLEPGNEEEAVETLRQYVQHSSSVVRTLYMIRADQYVYANTQVYYEIMGNPQLEQIYRLGLENYGALNISEPYRSPLSGQTLAYTMPIMDKYKNVLGVAVAELDLDLLSQRVASLMVDKHQTYVIISASGNPITNLGAGNDLLPRVSQSYPPEISPVFTQELVDLAVGVSNLNSVSGELVAVKSTKNRLGWSLIAFIEGDYFYSNVLKLYDNYRTAAIFWLVVLLGASYFMSRYFTHPVRKLVARMDRVNDPSLFSRLAENRQDEIGRLARSYNAMMERIHHLLQETKEMEARKNQYEFKMLQSQIAPHFLYNTLACISSLAKQRKIDEVRATIKALVGLLSFSFDRNQEFVTLREELQSVEMYAQIQRIRYGDVFTVEVDVDEKAMDCIMLKLTLQPLIENAIFHGIVTRQDHQSGLIRIRGSLENGMLRLSVQDNGVGMTSEQCGRLLSDRTEHTSRYRFTGIGIRNVHERIRLHFGDIYGLRVASRQGVGTIIRLRLPDDHWQEENVHTAASG